MLSTTPPSGFSYLSFALFLALASGLMIAKHELCFLFYTDDLHQKINAVWGRQKTFFMQGSVWQETADLINSVSFFSFFTCYLKDFCYWQLNWNHMWKNWKSNIGAFQYLSFSSKKQIFVVTPRRYTQSNHFKTRTPTATAISTKITPFKSTNFVHIIFKLRPLLRLCCR